MLRTACLRRGTSAFPLPDLAGALLTRTKASIFMKQLLKSRWVAMALPVIGTLVFVVGVSAVLKPGKSPATAPIRVSAHEPPPRGDATVSGEPEALPPEALPVSEPAAAAAHLHSPVNLPEPAAVSARHRGFSPVRSSDDDAPSVAPTGVNEAPTEAPQRPPPDPRLDDETQSPAWEAAQETGNRFTDGEE